MVSFVIKKVVLVKKVGFFMECLFRFALSKTVPLYYFLLVVLFLFIILLFYELFLFCICVR